MTVAGCSLIGALEAAGSRPPGNSDRKPAGIPAPRFYQKHDPGEQSRVRDHGRKHDVWRGPDGRQYAFCGAVSNTDGEPVPVVGVYASPIEVTRTENYPVLADGSLNPAFEPDEAEEVIVSRWNTPTGIRVTRTSRAWSYPGYDSFIIYEYAFENVSGNVLRDVFITFANTFAPSMFGYQRIHGDWSEAAFRGQPAQVDAGIILIDSGETMVGRGLVFRAARSIFSGNFDVTTRSCRATRSLNSAPSAHTTSNGTDAGSRSDGSFGGSARTDIKRWLQCVELTSCRAGFLTAGHATSSARERRRPVGC